MEPASFLTMAALAAASIIAPHFEVRLNWKNDSNRIIGIYHARPHFVYSSETANTCMAAVDPEPIAQVLPGSHADVIIPLGTDFQKDFAKTLSIIATGSPNHSIELRFCYRKGWGGNSTFLEQYFHRHISASNFGCSQLAEEVLSWDNKKSVCIISEITVENKACMRFSDSVVRIDVEASNIQKLS